MIAEGDGHMAPIAIPVVMQTQPRERYLLKADIEKTGASPGCPGCI